MSRIITDSKVSGQYIPSLSLFLDTKNAKKKMWALERRQNKASKSHLVLFRAATTAVRAARRRHSRHVRQGQHRRKRKAFAFGTSLSLPKPSL